MTLELVELLLRSSFGDERVDAMKMATPDPMPVSEEPKTPFHGVVSGHGWLTTTTTSTTYWSVPEDLDERPRTGIF